MTALSLKSDLPLANPLDIAEMVMMERNWPFDRSDEDELMTEVTGMWCKYHVWFSWNEEEGALMACSAFEHRIPRAVWPKVYALLAMANEKVWIGHFDLCAEDEHITYRHALLICEGAHASAEQMQRLLDIAIKECERFYPALQAVVWAGKEPKQALEFSLFETVGEA